MGIADFSSLQGLVLLLQEHLQIHYFVETGTYRGETAAWASQHFAEVITVEAHPKIHEIAMQQYAYIANISFFCGRSQEVLGDIIKNLDGPALFWLDAHWTGSITYRDEDECPLVAELLLLQEFPYPSVILIDNARLFLAPPPFPHDPTQWPNIAQVTALLQKHDRYIVVHENAILAVPLPQKPIVVAYCQKHAAPLQVPPQELISVGEKFVIHELPIYWETVMDVGAHTGSWTKLVLAKAPTAAIHLFEPSPQTFQSLVTSFSNHATDRRITLNNFALGSQEGTGCFYYYDQATPMSSLYRRSTDTETTYKLGTPTAYPVFLTTLDQYCDRHTIKHINFLKLDVEGAELDVLQGSRGMLTKGAIDYMQFEYGQTFIDAGITLEKVYQFLEKYHYYLFRILPYTLEFVPIFLAEYEDFQYANFLAVQERLTPLITGERHHDNPLDLVTLFHHYEIPGRGVIHIGIHEGQELPIYQELGMENLLLIDANPAVFAKVQDRLQALGYIPGSVETAVCAISNQNGESTLHITSSDMSSSLLPLKLHTNIYPSIREIATEPVATKTLDSLLAELQKSPSSYNFLNIDIQGAELMALEGALQTLPYIQAINIEVNYAEIYEGCPLVYDIDRFLEPYGFDRVATISPYHPTWGDALYVKRPVITMSSLGKNGRFANQLFQYAFLRIYSKQHNLRVETPPWIGQVLFGFSDPPITQPLPVVQEALLTNRFADSLILNSNNIYQNVDFWGYFQYPSSYYAPHQEFFRSLFQPVPPIREQLLPGVATLRNKGKVVVGIHIRMGDFVYRPAQFGPILWYLEWLNGYWQTLNDPVLFLASDDLDRVLPYFASYGPITSRDIGITLPEAPFFVDFFLLSHCDITVISNSSFSFIAAMLNTTGKQFFRPHVPSQKIIPFDPWDSAICPVEIFAEDQATYFPPASVDLFDVLGMPEDHFLPWLEETILSYYNSPTNPFHLANLRQARRYVADFLLQARPEIRDAFLADQGGLVVEALLTCGLLEEPLTASEQTFVAQLTPGSLVHELFCAHRSKS